MTPDKQLAKELAPQIWLHLRALGEKDTWLGALYSVMLIEIGKAKGIDISDHDKLVEIEAEMCAKTGMMLARAAMEGDLTVEDVLNEDDERH